MADKKVDKKNYVQTLASGAKGISKPYESPVKQLWNSAKEGMKGAISPGKTLTREFKKANQFRKSKTLKRD